jgi:hypothetical protein
MITKPILFWPTRLADIGVHLHRTPDDFLVVDTNCIYELRKLYKIRNTTPIFDPFPGYGEHYQEFMDHIASDHSLHIVGLATCRDILALQRDPSFSHASIEELLAAIATDSDRAGTAAIQWAGFRQRMKVPVDWSYLNWSNTFLAVLLVFTAVLIGGILFPNDRLIEAAAAALIFAGMYVSVRINVRDLFFSKAGRGRHAAAQTAAQKDWSLSK